jgi:D-beta-D-heptose 7-phosphate kinase/D-beta-D-heptose 1-phosphate adenosyltransferase
MLDKYIWGDVARISPEAPVPVVEVKKDTSCLGGAANVFFNLQALGAAPIMVGFVGDDPEGEWIKNKVGDTRGLFTVKGRPTTVKTRIIAHHQQVVRVDWEKRTPYPAEIEERLSAFIKNEDAEGILISDYNKGLLSKELMSGILPLAREKGVPVFVDPKVQNFFRFSPVTLITPNHLETEKIIHAECRTDDQIERAGRNILEQIETDYLFIKRGEKGLTVFDQSGGVVHIPAIAKEVFDVTGAGDTVLAAAALSLLSGASIQEAAVLSNTAAGIVVGKIGTAAASQDELSRMF